MSGFNIVNSSNSFRATNHAFKLNFQFQTRIAQADDDGSIHPYGFEFIPTQKILSGELDHNILVVDIRQFHQGLQPKDLKSPINHNGHLTLITSSPLEATFSCYPLSPVDELYHSGDGTVLCILAQVLQINNDKGWYYDAYRKCFKKVEHDGLIFYYHKCQTLVNQATTKYKIELMVLDVCNSANITIFDRDVSNFVGILAIELRFEHEKEMNMNVDEPANLPARLGCFVGKTFVFKVAVKISQWNDFTSFTRIPTDQKAEMLTTQRKKGNSYYHRLYSSSTVASFVALRHHGQRRRQDAGTLMLSVSVLQSRHEIRYQNYDAVDDEMRLQITYKSESNWRSMRKKRSSARERKRSELIDNDDENEIRLQLNLLLLPPLSSSARCTTVAGGLFCSSERMTIDPAIIDKFIGYRLAKGKNIPKKDADTDNVTTVDLEGRRLTFSDETISTSIPTPSFVKRLNAEASDECPSSSNTSIELIKLMKKIKIEKN
ncbi:replication factor A protein 1-like [Senna tora]|uniref:Replication factor A protein 1-like n=1 Tax=Senna tora TaxID=362788 RepID=A0A834X803_9FABA|nr:replication factor A protein 1-like [Senna tora]